MASDTMGELLPPYETLHDPEDSGATLNKSRRLFGEIPSTTEFQGAHDF